MAGLVIHCGATRRLFAAALVPCIALAIVLAAAPWTVATAQQVNRFIPENAKRGYVKHVQSMIITIDGQQVSLSPGANIRDTNNFLIVPTALPADGAIADYQVDGNGQVRRVWLLTPAEAAKPRKEPSRQ